MNGSYDRWTNMNGNSNSNHRHTLIHQQGFHHNLAHIPDRQSSSFDGRHSYFGFNEGHRWLGNAHQHTVTFNTNAVPTNMFPATRNFGNISSYIFQPPEIRQPNHVPIQLSQRSVQDPKPLQVSQQPLSSKYQRITYSFELKHDYCLFRLKFLLRATKVRQATETLQSAQLAFFRNIDPLFEIPHGFDRRLRSWWENRHLHLSEDDRYRSPPPQPRRTGARPRLRVFPRRSLARLGARAGRRPTARPAGPAGPSVRPADRVTRTALRPSRCTQGRARRQSPSAGHPRDSDT